MKQRETHRAHHAGQEGPISVPGEGFTGFQQPKGDQTMSGIWIEAHGEVAQRETTRFSSNGAYEASAALTRKAEEEVTIEFEDGTHVNLEGYSRSYSDFSTQEVLPLNRLFPDWEPVHGTWEIEIHGTVEAWTQQAIRYQQERPEMTVRECLELFQSWEETDTETIQKAIDRFTTEENGGA